MRNKSSAAVWVSVVALSLSLATNAHSVDTLSILHTFTGSPDGSQPNGGLTKDISGNLYGTTSYGGTNGDGTVFELSPNGHGGWTYNVIYSFEGQEDGEQITGTPIFDSQGNLYGTASAGGANGAGTVWEISPSSNGTWTLANVYSFAGGRDGRAPNGDVLLDRTGNIYGSASGAGSYGEGTAFEIATSGSQWSFRLLHAFGYGNDGTNPRSGLKMDRSGNLYGTTAGGGTSGGGTVYEMQPWNGTWVEIILANIDWATTPEAPPTFDSFGDLYGTAALGPGTYFGGVYKLNPEESAQQLDASQGQWQTTWLYLFPYDQYFNPYDGGWPNGQLVFDSTGNIYGETLKGGSSNLCGVIFELSPPQWTETVLWNFTGGDDGCNPPGQALVPDPAGNLFGTASGGGASNSGVVFELARH